MRIVALALALVACSKSTSKLGFDVNMQLVQVCMLSTSFRQQLDSQRSGVDFALKDYVKAVRESSPSVERNLAIVDYQLRGIANTRMMMNQSLHGIAFRDERLAQFAQLAHDLSITPTPAPAPGEGDVLERYKKAADKQHAEELAIEAECERVLAPFENQ